VLGTALSAQRSYVDGAEYGVLSAQGFQRARIVNRGQQAQQRALARSARGVIGAQLGAQRL
jgi:hypothetical protein